MPKIGSHRKQTDMRLKNETEKLQLLNCGGAYYYDDDNFKLILGDSLKELKKIEPKSIDMIFADPPYFLSSGGVTCQSGKQVTVDKGEWDKPTTPKEMDAFNKESRILYPIQIGIIVSVLRPNEPNLPIQIDNQLRNYR